MQFASREKESFELLKILESQVCTDLSSISEPLKRVVIPTVSGTAGKG
jgi:hypothetical protein